MSALGYLSRVRTVLRARRIARERTRRERWTRDQLLEFQRRRLGDLVEHATRGSSFDEAGVAVEVRVVDELQRGPAGKLKLVERTRSGATADPM